MPKQLNVNLAFTADTGKAAASIKSLQQQLTQLMNTATLNSSSLGLTKDIKEATTAVAQLKAQLEGAMTSSGTLDLTKFNDSLKASGMSLEEYRVKLSALGSDGTAAFSQLASSIASAEIPIKRANGLLTEMATTLANTARWQLSSSLLHGFIGGLQSAYGYAQDLNESLNNIRIVTGQSTEQMAQLAQKANQAAQQLSTRTTDYTNASLIYYQQGLDDKAVEERTRTTLKLSNVTRQSAEEVANQMTAIWNNFDDGTKSLEYYADAITALGAKTASSSSEIADGLSKFASIADTVGLSYEYATAALATVVAETRQSADTVGNAFKSLFARIQSLKLGETLEDGVGLTKYTQALETVGVQVLDINGNLRDADDILNDLGERWQNISSAQKAALAQTVAGQRQYAQMIALMDNWDKVKENVGIASESEGTLQKQQEIYAESWEASAKRVKASAEAIYDALLNDDFFIGFNDLLSGILDRINDLIKGLGGLKGVVVTLGALLSKVFSAQIASNIDRIVNNITGASVKGAQQQQKDAIMALQKQANEASLKGSAEGNAQAQGLKAQADLQQTLLNNQQRYNEEQLKTAQNLLDQNAHLREIARAEGEALDKAKARSEQTKRNELNKAVRNADPLLEEQTIDSLALKIKLGMDELEGFKNASEQANVTLTSFYATLAKDIPAKQKFEELNQIFQQNRQELSQLFKEAGLAPKEYFPLIQALNQVKREMTPESFKNFESTLDEIAAKMASNVSGSTDQLYQNFVKLYGSTEEANAAIDRIIANLDLETEAGRKLAEVLKALKNDTDNAKKSMDDAKTATMSFGQVMSGLSSITMSLASVINAVRSAIEIWNNDDLTWGEKALQIIPSVLMSVSMLANSITGTGLAALKSVGSHILLASGYAAEATAAGAAATASTKFGIAMTTAVPYVGALIAAATVAVVVIKGLADAFKAAEERTPEKQLEKATQAVNDSKDAYDKAKNSVDELRESFDRYNEIRNQLDNCKQGTEEWHTALNNLNTEVINLIDKFPELAKYLTIGKDGAFEISPEGFKEVSQTAAKNETGTYASYLSAKSAESSAKVGVEKKNVNDTFSTLRDGHVPIYAGQDINQDLDENNYYNNMNHIFTAIADKYVELVNSSNPDSALISESYSDIIAKSIFESFGQNLDSFIGKTYEEALAESDNNISKLFEKIAEESYDFESVDDVWAYYKDYSDSLAEDLKDSGLLEALENYKNTVNEQASSINTYSKMVGMRILTADEELSQKENISDYENIAGEFYSDLFNQSKKEVGEKSDDESYWEDTLGPKLVEYYEKMSNSILKDVKYDENGISFENEDGTDGTLSKDFLISYQAGIEASDQLINSISYLIDKTEELTSSEDKAAQSLGAILLRKDINNSGYALQQDINSAQLKDGGEYKGAETSEFRKQIGIYLDTILGDGLDGVLSKSKLEKLGYDTMEELIDAVVTGLESASDNFDKAKDTGSKFLNRYINKIEKDNKDQFNNLNTDEIKQTGALLRQSMEGAGYEGLSAMQNVLSKTSDLSGTIAALTSGDINWAATSAKDLSNYFNDLGISLDNVPENQLQGLIDAMKQISGISFESATATFASIHDIIDGIEKNDKIKAEDYQTLIDSVGEEALEGFFTPMADGTHKLTGDAQEFYNKINQLSLEEFKQGWKQETNKANTLERISSLDGSKFLSTEGLNSDNSHDQEGYNRIKNQLTYLDAVGAKPVTIEVDGEEKLISVQEILTDLTEEGAGFGKLNSETWTALNQMLEENAYKWKDIKEYQEQAQDSANDYLTMIASSMPNLQELQKLMDTDFFKGTGVGFEDLAGIWKKIFSEEDVIESISTIKEFKNAIEDVNGVKAVENVDYAWDSVKDKIQLSYDNLEDFKELEGQISDENFAEGIEEIAKSASNIDELNTVIEAGKGYGIDFTDTIISLLNQSDMTTEEHIKAIIDQLRLGHGEASKLAQEISRLSAENDSEQTSKEAQAERQSNYDQAKAENEAERNRINNSMSMGQEYKEQRNKELDASDRAIDIQSGLDDITAAASAQDMFPTDQLAMFEQGLDRIGSKADLTTMQVRQIGEAAASIVSGSDFFSVEEQLSSIKDAFSVDGVIDESNLKAYADSIKDIVLNTNQFNLEEKISTLTNELEAAGVPAEYLDREIADLILEQDNLTLQEKIALLEQNLTGALTPAMYLKDHVDELLNASGGNLISTIQTLNTLLGQGAIDASTYSSKMYEALENSDVSAEAKKQVADQTYEREVKTLNSYQTTLDAGQPQKEDYEGKHGSQEADKEAYEADTAKYNEALEATANTDIATQLDQAAAAYAEFIATINGADFQSLESLKDFYANMPAGIDATNEMRQSTAEYAATFDDLTSRADFYQQVLQGEDEEKKEAMQIDMERAIGAREMAEAYDLEGQALEDYAKSLEDDIDLSEEAVEAGSSLQKIALENAKTQLRLDKALDSSTKSLDDYGELVDDIAKAVEDNNDAELAKIKTLDKSSKTYKAAVKDLAGIADVNEELIDKRFGDLMAKDAEKVKKAFAGDQDAINAVKDDIGDLTLQGSEWGQELGDGAIEASNQMQEAFANMDVGDFMPSTDPMIEQLNQAYEQGKIGFDELCDYLRSQDMEPEFDWADPVREAVSEAEAAAAQNQAGDIFAENAAVEGEMEPVEGESESVHETVGFTESISTNTAIRGIKYQEDANSKPISDTVQYVTATKTVTPDVKEEEATEKTKTMVPKLKGATKTAGGASKGGGGGGGGGGGRCFAAGTLIKVPGGYKKIEDIKVGNLVISYNENTMKNEYSAVLQTMIHYTTEPMYKIYIKDDILEVTGIHKFLINRFNNLIWVPVNEIQIGDLVLSANGSWYPIFNIEIQVKSLTVYNFEVSNNHNYYVGKNSILAHNKGGGRRGGGGRARAATAKIRGNDTADHKDYNERYHVVDKELQTLEHQYTDIANAKDKAFGAKHVKNIMSEIEALEKQIKTQAKYKKEIDKYLAVDLASISKGASTKNFTQKQKDALTKTKATYNETHVTGSTWDKKNKQLNVKEATTVRQNAVDVSGYGGAVQFDADGNIANIDQLKEKATQNYNEAAKIYAQNHKDDSEIKLKKNPNKKDRAAYLKKLERQRQISNEWAKQQAMYEQYMANLDQYEETLEKKRAKITEQIEKEIELIQAKLEKTSYQVEVKADIDDMSLKIINHALDMMGDKARNATARLGQLAEQLKTLNSTSSKMDRNGKKSNTGPEALSDNVWAISDILSNVTSSYKTIKDNNGDIQYFNKENAKDSDYLNGNDLVKKMMAGGDSAKEVVNIIGKQQNITKDQFKKMMEYATSELERIQQMKEIRLQMFDIMSQTYDEETEKMDRILDKQSFYMERANGYKNVLDIIGRANFAYDETKYSNGREAGRDLEEQIDNSLLTQSQERIKTIDREKQNQESLRKLSVDSRTNAQNFIKALEATPDTLKDLNKEQKEIYDANLTEWSGYSDQQKKDAIEQWKQDIDAFDEQIQKADDKIDELTLEKQTAFENALTLTEENWERAMERAKEAFEQAMAGAASSLELLLDGLDRYDKTHSTMVADYEKVYQLRNLELQAQESIDKANDPRIKRELLSIQEEITAASTQDKKMSQYELDYLRQKLELKEAEAALEDAQKAKTQVSLTRDNEGNFGYVYTADDEAVDDAEKNYADKIYEMRKTNQEYIQSLQTELAQAQQDAINAIMEINGRKDLTPEEREAEIAKISEDYHTLHTNLIDQFNLALTNSNDVFGQYSELYSQITGDTMALNVDYVKDFKDTQYSIQTGWTSTQQVANAFGNQMTALLGEGGTLSKINAAYEANNKTTFENAGQDISTFAADSIKALTGEDGLNKAVQNLTKDMETLGKTASENFENILTKVKDIEKDFTTYIGAMETSVKNLASALRDAAKAMAEIEDVAATATTADDNNDDNNDDDKKNVPSGGGKKYKYYGSRGKKVRKTIRTARQANRLSYKAAKAVLSRKQEDKIKKQYRSRSAQKRAMIKKAKAIVKKQLKTNKFAGVKIRFDTGGYTGDWNGNDGRVAMLHKKEIVLNQQDTSNILSAVGMIRDIAQKIDLNALSQSGALSSGISGINGVSNGTLEQEVHITAEFPNATDRNEISEAFNNIIGLAAQYANR